MAHNISRKGCFKCGNRASIFHSPSFPSSSYYLLILSFVIKYSRPHRRELYVAGAALLQLPQTWARIIGMHRAAQLCGQTMLFVRWRRAHPSGMPDAPPSRFQSKMLRTCAGQRWRKNAERLYIYILKKILGTIVYRIVVILGISRACVPTRRCKTMVLRRVRLHLVAD